MKRFTIIAILLSAICILNQSCLKDECEAKATYTQYLPVYLQTDEIRQNIVVEGPRELCKPGKLFYYQDYIYVNEYRQGIHVIDSRDANNPVNVAFVNIPGNVDVAVKGNIMYADNYIDLISLDVSNPANPIFLNRTIDVFNALSLNEDLGHLVYYENTEVTEEIDCQDPRWGTTWWPTDGSIFVDVDVAFDSNLPTISVNNNSSNLPNGIAGSLAAFSVIGETLYVIDGRNLDVFDLTNISHPSFENSVDVGWNIETLFPYKNDLLFIGSETGLFIYSVADPSNPQFIFEFEHARACDPVIVKDDIAYVTLRDGTRCQGFINQLDVIDVSTPSAPSLLASFPMDNPRGLSIKGNTLYLCEGEFGLKAFDITTWQELDTRLLDTQSNLNANDVIALPHKDVALVIGDSGYSQFDISNPSDLQLISTISADETICD